MKTIAITIEENVLERIDRLGSKKGEPRTNRSRVIREAVSDYLARVEKLAQEERERDIIRRHRVRLAREATALIKEQAKL